VSVGVSEGARVKVGVSVEVGVKVSVGVSEGARVKVGVSEGTRVGVGESVPSWALAENNGTPRNPKTNAITNTSRNAMFVKCLIILEPSHQKKSLPLKKRTGCNRPVPIFGSDE